MPHISFLPPRDSKLWYLFMGLSFLAALAGETDQIDLLLPVRYHDVAHALIRLSATAVGVLSGLMRMSPQDISSEGRALMLQKNADSADLASKLATVAAEASEQAVESTSVAADMATAAAARAKDASGTTDNP